MTPPPTPVCAVIPARDEEDTIASVASGARAVVDRVIVVDNGSGDATAARARDAGASVVAEPHPGYGRACLRGARAAPDGSILIFLDGDGADDPKDAKRLADKVRRDEADLVVGSRVARRDRAALRAHQRAGNWLFASLIRRLWAVPVSDLGPMRAIRRADLLALDMRSRTYGWPVEMVVKAARAGLRVVEVPVAARPRAGGRSKVSGSPRASLLAGAHFALALVRYGLGPSPARGDPSSRSADVQGRVAPLGRGLGDPEQRGGRPVEGKPGP